MVIDGKKIAKEIEEGLKREVAEYKKKSGRDPRLLAVELSDDLGSKLYLKLKKAAAQRLGIEFQVLEKTVLAVPQGQSFLNFDGIFIQHPPGYDKQKWQELADQIPPQKDVDCLTTENLELIKQGKPRFLPATVKAVIYCLERSLLAVRQGDSLKYVIIGRSPILGLPLYHWLKSLGAQVTLLHSQSTISNQQLAIKNADVLVSSIGKPKIITADMVKKGVIAIDCGSPLGDVAFSEVARKASFITPVPGGVGPLTVVSLMENVVVAASKKIINHIS